MRLGGCSKSAEHVRAAQRLDDDDDGGDADRVALAAAVACYQ